MPASQIAYIASGLLCSGCACASDMRQGRIPNKLSGAGVFLGLCLHAGLGGWKGLGSAALSGLLLGCFFLIFYLLGGMGAGDVKAGTAMGCLLGISSLSSLLLGTTISGALIALTFSFIGKRGSSSLLVHLATHFKGFKKVHVAKHPAQQSFAIPYALPIFLGCCCSTIEAVAKGGA